MGLFDRFKKEKSSEIKWRTSSGEIKCQDENCSPDCESGCPIAIQSDGVLDMMTGNYPRAVSLLEKALEIAPDFGEAWNNLGGAYGGQGNYQKAYDCYLKAHECNPTRPNQVYGLMLASRDLKKYSECLHWCEVYSGLSSDGRERPIREEIEKHKKAQEGIAAILELRDKTVSGILKSEGLQNDLSEAFLDIPKLTSDIRHFCEKTYSERQKRNSECYITSYYAAICLAIYRKKGSSFSPENALSFLQSQFDTEFCDVQADKLFGWKQQGPESDRVWEAFYPYLLIMMRVVRPGIDPPEQLLIPGMEGAIKLGIATAEKYYRK